MNVAEFSHSPPARGRPLSGIVQATGAERPRAPVTVVLPFYNEANYIPATLLSLLEQDAVPRKLVLVDNGSTDNSLALCQAITAGSQGPDVTFLSADRPGKIYALEAAAAHLTTEYVAFCDADTLYPRHYFRKAIQLFIAGDASLVGLLAIGTRQAPLSFASKAQRVKTAFFGRLLAKQCHCGGFGQIFRTDAYRNIGGYDASIWPFVLEDHEIVHRLLSIGTIAYDPELWCKPSIRRADRTNVSWSLKERLVYHLTPFKLKNWYFYDYIAPRLQNRKLMNDALRDQPWAA